MNAKKIIFSLLIIGFLVAVGSASAKYMTYEPAVFEESNTRSIEGLTPFNVAANLESYNCLGNNLYAGLGDINEHQNSKYIFDSNDTRIYVASNTSSSGAVYNAGVEKGLFTFVGEVEPTFYHGSRKYYGFKVKNPGTLVGDVTPPRGVVHGSDSPPCYAYPPDPPIKVAVQVI
ncbi:MAG: hypothetical protein LBR15_11030 [Methanobrevibacter sp.]|nr:hypothetical protein [Candidatus Methanovirga australis]